MFLKPRALLYCIIIFSLLINPLAPVMATLPERVGSARDQIRSLLAGDLAFGLSGDAPDIWASTVRTYPQSVLNIPQPPSPMGGTSLSRRHTNSNLDLLNELLTSAGRSSFDDEWFSRWRADLPNALLGNILPNGFASAVVQPETPAASAQLDQVSLPSTLDAIPQPDLVATNTQPTAGVITFTVYIPQIARAYDPDTLISPGTGGELTSPDGRIKISFDPGSVATQAVARYSEAPTHDVPPSLKLTGLAFTLDAHGQTDGVSLSYFAPKVTTLSIYDAEFKVWQTEYLVTPTVRVDIAYTNADVAGIRENSLRLYRRDPVTAAWHAMPAVVDVARNHVQATIERDGLYALFGEPSSTAIAFGPLSASGTLSVSQALVVLDPDHGGSDPGGTVTYPTNFAAQEKNYNLRVAQLVRDRLLACGTQVLMTREGDDSVSPAMRVAMINGNNPDAAATLAFDIVNHFMGDNLVTGTGVAAWVDSSKPLQSPFGEQVTDRVQEYTGLRNRGLKPGGWIYVVANVSNVITYTHAELAFMDNFYDRAIMDDSVGMGGIANGTFMAIADSLGGSSTCEPGFQFPAPLSAVERERLRKLGYQNWSQYGGDPVNFSTGNHVQQFTDWQIPGQGGFDFVLQRTYNSLDTRDGLFGFGWSSWLDAYLRLANDGSIDVRYPDGSGVYFLTEDAGYTAGQDGVFDALTRNGPDFMLVTHDQMRYHFQVFGFQGLLMSMTDRHGNTIELQRDADGHLAGMVDASGQHYTVTHSGGRIASITDTLGRTIRYDYDAAGDLIRVTDANGGSYTFGYDDHRLTGLTDPEGFLYLQNLYDGAGRVVEQIDASSSHSFFAYGDGETTFTDNLGHTTITRYDSLSRVTEAADALGQTELFAYDADYNVTAYTDRRGNVWTYAYDDRGNLLTETDPLGYVNHYTYNAANDLTSTTDPGGPGGAPRTTTFAYDGEGNLVRVERPDGTTIQMAYDTYGHLRTYTDPNAHNTIYTYDAQGNLVEVIDPLGYQTQYAYDAVGRQVRMTDANGHVARFEYDGNDNITRVIDPRGRATTFDYDGNDNLTRMTDRRGGVTAYDYDENLKLVAKTDPEGHITTYAYDAMYNRVRMTDPRGNATQYRYDGLYRLIETEDAQGGVTRFEYDANNNVTRATDALGFSTRFEYDMQNRLVRQIDSLGGVTRFEYDAVDRLTRLVNPRGAATQHTYDLLDRLTRMRDALGGEWTTEYDAAGNVVRTADASHHVTTMRYDAADRLIEQFDPGGHRTAFAYDGVGNLTATVDALGRTMRYSYDENDNLASVADALGGVMTLEYDAEDNLVARTDANRHTTRFTYNLDGLLIELTEAGGQATTFNYDQSHNLIRRTNAKGNAWDYRYDARNYLIREIDPLGNMTLYAVDPFGRTTRATDANNIATGYAYDALSRLIAVTQNEQPSSPADHQTNVITRYAYDAVGNLLSTTDANGESTAFAYDLLDRLTQETDPLGHAWNYEYDAVGNLTVRADANGQITRYVYTADDLLRSVQYPDNGSVTFSYDAVHNQTEMHDALGVTRNAYDALSRRVSSTNHLGQQVGYAYDAVGNLTRLTYPDGQAMRYEYDPTDFVSRILDPSNNAFVATRDATHNIVRIDNPNQTIAEYDFDAAERLTAVRNLQNGGAIISRFSYTLDPVGNRTRIEGTYSWRQPSQLNFDYSYDPLYRLTRSADNESHFTDYAYDAVGNRLRLTTNDDPTLVRAINVVTTTYTYDAANELVASVRELTPRGSVDRALQTVQPLNAFTHEVSAQSGKHIQTATATELSSQADALISSLESGAPPSSVSVAADLATLTTAVQTAGAEGRIDNAGVVNSLLAKLNRAGDANQQRGGELFTTLYDYDLNGNRIRRTAPDETTGNERDQFKTEYAYTFESQLARAQDFRSPDSVNWLPGDETQLTYDGYGRVFRRLHDQHSGGGGDQKWVDYVYDGLDPIAEYENPNPQRVDYYRGLDRVLSMKSSAGQGVGTLYYYHYDGLGSVSAMTKQQGQSAHTYRYNDYGIILDNNGKAADASNFTNPHNHYTYTGQEWDENLNLFHFYAREYDPQTGVWLQRDPYRGRLDVPVTLQRYGYVGNNPTNYLDRYGYCEILCLIAIGVGVTVVVGFIAAVFIDNSPPKLPEQRNVIDNLIGYDASKEAKQTIQAPDKSLGEKVAAGAIITFHAAKNGIVAGIATYTAGRCLQPFISGASKIDPAKLIHIFGKPGHGLDVMVKALGSQEKVYQAVYTAFAKVASSYTQAQLHQGIQIAVSGFTVTVRGEIVNGIVKIGTFFIAPK